MLNNNGGLPLILLDQTQSRFLYELVVLGRSPEVQYLEGRPPLYQIFADSSLTGSMFSFELRRCDLNRRIVLFAALKNCQVQKHFKPKFQRYPYD